MKKKFKGEQCYFCEDPATSQEHLPPELMFAGFPCNKITVPSCDLHNQGKSFFDNCILKGFLLSLYLLREQGYAKDLSDDVQKAIELVKDRLPSIWSEIQSGAKEVEMFQPGEVPEGRNPRITFTESHIDHGMWIRRMTAGLVWDATKSKHPELDWYEGAEVFDNFHLPITNPSSQASVEDVKAFNAEKEKATSTFESFPWVPGWPSGQTNYPEEIYEFEFSWSPQSSYLYFHHRFFSKFRFWVRIKCPKGIATKIREYTRERWKKAAIKELTSRATKVKGS